MHFHRQYRVLGVTWRNDCHGCLVGNGGEKEVSSFRQFFWRRVFAGDIETVSQVREDIGQGFAFELPRSDYGYLDIRMPAKQSCQFYTCVARNAYDAYSYHVLVLCH